MRASQRETCAVDWCPACALVRVEIGGQLDLAVASGTMRDLDQERRAMMVGERHAQRLHGKPLGAGNLVVEVAPDRSELLDEFAARGVNTLWLSEPKPGERHAAEMYDYAAARDLALHEVRADLLYGGRMFAQTEDLNGYAAGLAWLLDDDGIGVFEVDDLIEWTAEPAAGRSRYGTLNLFSLTSLIRILQRRNLEVLDCETLPQSGQLRCYVGCDGDLPGRFSKRSPAIRQRLAFEAAWGVNHQATYRKWVRDAFRHGPALGKPSHQAA